MTSTGVPVAVLTQIEGQSVVRTPCGAIAAVSGGVALGEVDVVLDPGHGGLVDPGAVSPTGLVEAELNLRVVEATLAELSQRGITAASTRSGNYLTTLQVRSLFADDLGAQLMVSIHHNAPTSLESETPG
ncbi:MAG: N-acetylmuramoyl-L-alanine amidase, partial [Acidimicrobiales bacterium]